MERRNEKTKYKIVCSLRFGCLKILNQHDRYNFPMFAFQIYQHQELFDQFSERDKKHILSLAQIELETPYYRDNYRKDRNFNAVILGEY